MLKKSLVFIMFILFIMTGCIDKKDEIDLNNQSKFEKMISEIKEYKKNISRTTTVAVQDGIYIKSGAIYDFYTLSKLDSLTFQEKVVLLEKIDKAPTAVTVVVSDYAKNFYDYISLEDLLVNGTNATSKIGMYTTVYDIESGKYIFAIGEGMSQPVIGIGGGTFTEAQTVSITCSTAGAKIRYTTDGTDPVSTSLLYSSALTISATTTIKARAYSSDGLVVSSTVTALYTIKTATVSNGLTYAGKIYTGKAIGGSGTPVEYGGAGILTISEPSVRSFNCDAYFTMKGVYSGTGVGRYFYVSVIKESTLESTTYFIEGLNFERRIWLRYGAGKYLIEVYPIRLEKNVQIDEPYDGDIISYSWNPYLMYKFEVTNTRDEDGRFLYPSNFIQSDEQVIYDTAIAELKAVGKLNATVKEKALCLHDYIIRKLTYEYNSLITLKRRKQDAITCLNSGWAVCEGYTSLYNALLRSIGIPAKAIAGNNERHAWTNVQSDGVWYMVDTTWDDYDVAGVYDYKYFWLPDNTGYNNDHSWNDDRDYRNIKEKEVSIFMKAKEGEY